LNKAEFQSEDKRRFEKEALFPEYQGDKKIDKSSNIDEFFSEKDDLDVSSSNFSISSGSSRSNYSSNTNDKIEPSSRGLYLMMCQSYRILIDLGKSLRYANLVECQNKIVQNYCARLTLILNIQGNG